MTTQADTDTPQAQQPPAPWLTDGLIQQRIAALMRREKDDDNVDVARFGSAI